MKVKIVLYNGKVFRGETIGDVSVSDYLDSVNRVGSFWLRQPSGEDIRVSLNDVSSLTLGGA